MTIRLAHCSDLHLLSHDGARWLEFANKRWIGAMNLLSNRSRHHHTDAFEHMIADLNELGVEHVLCTGDVTNLALAQEFAYARSRFDQLALGPAEVTVVPGNHDAYVAEGIAHFASQFDPYASSDAGWAWSAEEPAEPGDDLRWPLVRVRGEFAVIGLTTSRATPWFTAYGRVGNAQLARLRRALSDERLRGKARVVAIHHPPAGKRAESWIRGLRDHQAFAAVIAEVGAELVLHGHEHRDMRESLPGPRGPVPVLGVVSGTYEAGVPARTARYRIIEISDGQIRSDHCRVWHRDRKIFAPDVELPLAAHASA
jgi:3',5'-cyclic AMP phosphodiesterase CpdA